jgi:hypothetical protein
MIVNPKPLEPPNVPGLESLSHLCWVFVEAGLQAGQADLKVGLYTNTRELRSKGGSHRSIRDS